MKYAKPGDKPSGLIVIGDWHSLEFDPELQQVLERICTDPKAEISLAGGDVVGEVVSVTRTEIKIDDRSV